MTKDVTQELSQRMLTGWILLAECCTLGCNVPLVESKRLKKIECVSCKSTFQRDADQMIPITTGTPADKEVKAPTPSTSTPAPTATPTTASKLNGFAYDLDFDDDEELVPLTSEEVAAMEERRKRNDKTSKIMGEKLLAGWTMLSDVCPKPECYQPLMRDNQKQMWCLGCNTRVIRQEEFDPTKHTIVTSDSSLTSTSSTSQPTPSVNPSTTSTSTAPAAIPTPASASANSNVQLKTTSFSSNSGLNFHSGHTHSIAPTSVDNDFHPAHTHSFSHSHTHSPAYTHDSCKHSSSEKGIYQPPHQPEFITAAQYACSVLDVKIHELAVSLAQAKNPDDIRVISAALRECAQAKIALGGRLT